MSPSSHYSARVRELFRGLPRAGALPAGRGSRVAGEASALDRGVWARFEARVDGGRVTDCAFRAFGCPHTLAACAFAAEASVGRAVHDGIAADARRLEAELAVPREKFGRLLVVEDALLALSNAARRVQ